VLFFEQGPQVPGEQRAMPAGAKPNRRRLSVARRDGKPFIRGTIFLAPEIHERLERIADARAVSQQVIMQKALAAGLALVETGAVPL
jgi:hypothetical protein